MRINKYGFTTINCFQVRAGMKRVTVTIQSRRISAIKLQPNHNPGIFELNYCTQKLYQES